jgi:hypothetical protein
MNINNVDDLRGIFRPLQVAPLAAFLWVAFLFLDPTVWAMAKSVLLYDFCKLNQLKHKISPILLSSLFYLEFWLVLSLLHFCYFCLSSFSSLFSCGFFHLSDNSL